MLFCLTNTKTTLEIHDDAVKWKHFPRYWPFVRGIHRSPANSSHKGQWRGALMFSLICSWINGWVNNREAGDLKRHRTHYGVIVIYEKKDNLRPWIMCLIYPIRLWRSLGRWLVLNWQTPAIPASGFLPLKLNMASMISFNVVLSGCMPFGISIFSGHFSAHQSTVAYIVVGLHCTWYMWVVWQSS